MLDFKPGDNEGEVAYNRAILKGFTPEIRLTPATEALKADLISGMEQALFGPESTAIMVEGTDTTDNFRLDHTKFLARIAFLHLENASAADADRPFDLAVGTFAMHLDLEKISGMSEEELRSFDYDRFDGVYLMMLDTLLGNASSRSIHHGSRNSRYGFQYYESPAGPAVGYRRVPGQTDDIFKSAFQIDTGYQATQGKPRLGTYLEELQVVVDILKNGQPHQNAMNNLVQASQEGDAITIIPRDSEEEERVVPFMYGMFKDAVETPDLRDQMAGHQYWYVQSPGYLRR